MTKLVYVFPFFAGCLKFAVPTLSRFNEEYLYSYHQIWMVFIVTLFSAGFCIIYILIQSIVLYFFFPKWLSSQMEAFVKDVKANPWITLAFLNGLASGGELTILFLIFSLQPNVSVTLLLASLSQGQLVTAIICDIFGYLWIPKRQSYEQALAGGSFLLLGTILLQVIPASFARYQFGVGLTVLGATLAGFLSFINLALTRRLSSSFGSYWAGTSASCFSQCIAMTIVSFTVDPSRSYVEAAESLFNDNTKLFLLFVVSLCQIVTSACVQLLGDFGGFFTTLAPVAAGQLLLSGIIEVTNSFPNPKRNENLINMNVVSSGTLYTGMLLVFVGSTMGWIGRWPFEANSRMSFGASSKMKSSYRRFLPQAKKYSTQNPHQKTDVLDNGFLATPNNRLSINRIDKDSHAESNTKEASNFLARSVSSAQYV